MISKKIFLIIGLAIISYGILITFYALADMPLPFPPPSQIPSLNATIFEGDLIRAIGEIDVYIVKYIGSKKFKRLILSPSVFNSYGHLKWTNIKDIDGSLVDSFVTSDLVRAADDFKVYKLISAGDTGQRIWIKTTEAFIERGFDWDAIYQVNQVDRDSYIDGPVITK
jgi:hypothetical protein